MSVKSRPLSVRARVLLFVAVAAVGAALLGALCLQQSQQSHALSDLLVSDLHLNRAALQVDMVHDGLLATTRAALLAGPTAPDADKAAVREELAGMGRQLSDAQARVAGSAADPAVRQAEADLRPLIDRYSRTAAALVESALTGGADTPALRQSMEADYKQLEQALDGFASLIGDQAQRRLAQRDALHASQRWWTLGVAAAMLATLLAGGLQFARSLRHCLGAEPHALSAFAHGIADGALDTRFHTPPAGSASVAAALEGMRDRLADTVASIRSGAQGVAVGSAQIATGNQDLAERTMRQASSLQQAAQGMAEVSGSAQQAAAHAHTATALADDSSAVAQRGGAAVQQVQAAMAGIDATSRRIADITGVIDGIAAQTNFLALNASVEASRAGEHGQGFAVVAAEVRRLAQRSAAAAQEIRALTTDSLAQVADGNRQVAAAGATMGDIMDQVGRVHALIAAIGSAAQHQNDGIAQVGQSVVLLDQGTQQNAALVEQSAAAAAMLRDQAQSLADAVGAFRLGSPA